MLAPEAILGVRGAAGGLRLLPARAIVVPRIAQAGLARSRAVGTIAWSAGGVLQRDGIPGPPHLLGQVVKPGEAGAGALVRGYGAAGAGDGLAGR